MKDASLHLAVAEFDSQAGDQILRANMFIAKEELEKEFRDELKTSFEEWMIGGNMTHVRGRNNEVKLLRKETDAPMIFCIFSLDKSKGNIERALEIAREFNNLGINWQK